MKNIKKIIITAIIVLVVLIAGLSAWRSTRDVMRIGGGNFGNTLDVQSSSSLGGVSRMSKALPGSSPAAEFGSDAVDTGGATQESEVVGQVEKKVIKNGNMTLRVDRVDEAVAEISAIAKGNGGETFSSNFRQSPDKIKSGNMVVKVPVNNFEKAFEEIKKVASLVVQESTAGQDVTEQYTDLQSRLRNKQAEEQSIAKILEQSGKITDVLEVTRELSRVRGEIEVLQGRIRFMDAQTDMATINISLSEDPDVAIVDSWRPLQVAKDSINDLIKSIQGFVDFVIVLVIKTIPVLILYLAVLGLLYWIGKKIYDKIKSRVKPEQKL